MGVPCSSNILILGEASKALVMSLVTVRGMVPGAGRHRHTCSVNFWDTLNIQRRLDVEIEWYHLPLRFEKMFPMYLAPLCIKPCLLTLQLPLDIYPLRA